MHTLSAFRVLCIKIYATAHLPVSKHQIKACCNTRGRTVYLKHIGICIRNILVIHLQKNGCRPILISHTCLMQRESCAHLRPT